MKLAGLLLACLVAVATVPASAFAQAPDEAARVRARKYFEKGQKLYNLGKFEEALGQYEKAYDEVELPELLFNIAQCHRNLDHFELAIFSFKKYLREKPAADNRAAVEKVIEELEAAKAKRDAEHPPQRLPPVPTGHEPDGVGITKPPPAPTPYYKRWWFWTGVAVVAGGGLAAGVLIAGGGGGVPGSDLGNIPFAAQ